jgi:hypothetical protein
MDLIDKYLTEAKGKKLSKEIIDVLKRVKGWDYQETPQGFDFFFVKDKRIPDGGKWAKIQMPYFDEFQEKGKKITGYAATYSGNELLSNPEWNIKNIKDFENVLKQMKKRLM